MVPAFDKASPNYFHIRYQQATGIGEGYGVFFIYPLNQNFFEIPAGKLEKYLIIYVNLTEFSIN